MLAQLRESACAANLGGERPALQLLSALPPELKEDDDPVGED